jgi:hypothetical protein
MHPGSVLALCGLGVFWSRLIGGAIFWLQDATSRTPADAGPIGTVRTSLRQQWFNFDLSISGLSAWLLLAALGSVWVWQDTGQPERLPWHTMLLVSAAVGALVRVSATVVGPGGSFRRSRLGEYPSRIGEIVLLLGIVLVASKRYRSRAV